MGAANLSCAGVTMALLSGLGLNDQARAQGAPAPLALERTIVLPNVRGRIDHLEVDPQHHRLIEDAEIHRLLIGVGHLVFPPDVLRRSDIAARAKDLLQAG